jgi:enoyl-CoA hydratase/carnithine racemase
MPVVLTEDADHVRLLTMNRPERLNAFDQALFAGLGDALGEAAADDDVHVVVLTGAGRAFSAGADLQSGFGGVTGDAPRTAGTGDNPFARLQEVAESFPKPLVAAVNGVGVGLGFTILGYCDLVFVARSARLRTPFVDLGVVPEASSSYLFPLRMGWQHAARALLAGEWFDAELLVASGLGTRVCEDGQVVDVALEAARAIAAGPPSSVMATKRLMLDAHRSAIVEARARETAAMAEAVGSPANVAAIAAFRSR